MKAWQIVNELEQIYWYSSCYRLGGITSDDFQYVSDFEDLPPLTATQYEEHLKKQLENFHYPHSLEILEKHVSKTIIEMILQKDMHSLDHYVYSRKLDFHPFLEPRLLQCEIENGMIRRMHLCSPENMKIPAGIQEILLKSCRDGDLEAAREAIKKGAYAWGCRDNERSCLSYAAESGSADLCRLLAEDEADFKIMDWNTIFYAVKNPNAGVLEYLLRQGAPTDVVTRFADDDHPMTPLDYARYLRNESAEKLLVEAEAPTLDELKNWCFNTAGFRIPLSESGGEMSISAVGDEVNESTGWHVGQSESCLWMELENCCAFVIPFFIKYFSKRFEPYLEDNLVTLDDAGKGLGEISDFIGMLENDFDNPKVTKLISHEYPGAFIEWGERSSLVGWYFSDEDRLLLWKAHRGALIDFYRELHTKMNAIIAEAKKCGDRYITFVGT